MNKNKSKVIVIAALLVISIAFFIGIGIYNTPENRLYRQLDLGEKYLAEQDYEQAVVEFDKAIEIDPMSVEAYLGKAQAYIGLDDYENALLTLQQGYEKTGDERLLSAIQEIEQQMDFVIEWEDKTLETLIRKYLKKPEGDIYGSEVCDIKELHIIGTGVIADSSEEADRISDEMEPEEAYGGEAIHTLNDMQYFTSLEKLEIMFNDFTDFNGLSGLVNLTYLNLDNNNISDISALGGMTNLEFLALARNNINDISVLSGLVNLTHLFLSFNNISDISALNGLVNLTSLELCENNISDISVLGGLVDLTLLCLGNNNISDISALSGLVNLTALLLWSNNITDISALGSLVNLEYLDLQNNDIDDFSPVSFVTNLRTE